MRKLFRNPGYKLAALVLAYLFWLAILEESQGLRQMEIPVRFEGLDAGVALVRDGPSSVIVRVQASEFLIKDLQPPDIEARADLAGMGVGTHVIRFAPNSPNIVSRRVGVRVVEVFPPSFELKIEPRTTAEVPVVATLTGEPARGYRVGAVEVTPTRVRIEGPKSAIDHISSAGTAEIAVTGRNSAIEREVNVSVVSPDVIVVSNARARVHVAIEEIQGERTFSGVPIAPVGTRFEVNLSPGATRISVRGPEHLLAALEREDLVASVHLDGLAPRAQSYPVPVRVDFRKDAQREALTAGPVGTGLIAVQVRNHRAPSRSQPRPSPARVRSPAKGL